MAYILSNSLRSGRWRALASLRGPRGDITSVTLHERGQCLAIERRRGGRSDVEHLRRSGGRWRRGPECGRPEEDGGVEVAIREGINEPPEVVARAGGRELVLAEREERLRDVALAQVREVSWREADGRRVSGGLMLPRDQGSGPFPLLILSNHYWPDRFYPDGVFPQFGAQAFVRAGIAVLQIDAIEHREIRNTPAEGPALVDRVDSAVAELASQGLVDPARVGLLGFSRGGFAAHYLGVFPGRTRLAAALADDSFNASCTSMLGFMGPGDPRQLEWAAGPLGGRPFWSDRRAWLERSPHFNLNRLRTPLLVVDRGTGANTIVGAQETMAALRSIGAPIQHAVLTTASHQPLRPREREAFIRLSLDWFRFWLQGREDPDPGKAGTYGRWRAMGDRLQR